MQIRSLSTPTLTPLEQVTPRATQPTLASIPAAAEQAPSDGLGTALAGALVPSSRSVTAAASTSIPDVAGILSSGLRYEHLNQAITSSYVTMAEQLQAIIDPSHQHQGLPNWFAIACYASRSAGQGMAMAHRMDEALSHSTTTIGGLARFAFSAVPGPVAGVAAQAAALQPPTRMDLEQTARVTARSLHDGHDAHDGKQHMSDHLELLDPRLLAVTAGRMGRLLADAPGHSLHAKGQAVTRALLDGLEDGNRGIFADMGKAGADYLRFREAHKAELTPDLVLEQFSSDGTPSPEQARAIYSTALATAQGKADLPTDLGTVFPGDSRPMFPAAFALYEQAGRTADPQVRDRIVAYANNLLAWREQHDVVQPAFGDPQQHSEGVRHWDVWELTTPLVDIKMRAGVWRYSEYVSNLEEKGAFSSLLTPGIAKCHWGRFEHRWPAIMNAFDTAYANKDSVWPMPNPDPLKGIDEPA